jgi:lysophospholipid acyltransferase (LPLAT)-like uncharacterized protein
VQRESAKADSGSASGDLRSFTLRQRVRASLIGGAGYFFISLIGRTLRWQAEGVDHLDQIHNSGHRAILTFWHGRIFPATYYFRKRGIVVMTSMNLDGEAIAQCIRRLGYGVARGSSSRGGFRALAQLVRAIKGGKDAGFTIDGPRGPRHVAKQGPILLAFKTGAAIACFHVSLQRKVQLKSWDQFQIPLPFSRAVLLMAPPLWVPTDATEAHLRDLHRKMQSTLDDLRARGDAWFG